MKESLWVWKNVVNLSEPKPDIRSAFRVVIDNNWQGIAYLMLEVSGLDFIEAIQVNYVHAFTAGFPNTLVPVYSRRSVVMIYYIVIKSSLL